jgi:glycosyltransferase involved in cell wall biosynthesis
MKVITGLLAQLPSPPPGKTGWPWTEETPGHIYDTIAAWPKLSIITPTYNQGQFIEETIRSILLQNYPNLEYIIIDGGSTDDTAGIIKKYSPWITYWESEKDKGQSHAINKGLKKYTGDIVTWLNSDDTYLPGALNDGIGYLIKHPETGIVFADSVYTDLNGIHSGRTRPLPSFNYLNFVTSCENPISQPSSFMRREVVEKLEELDPAFYYCMDWDLWLRAGLYFKIDYIPEIWSTYRLHAESKTVADFKKAAPELAYMYNKFFAREDLPAEIRKLKKKAMMNMYYTGGGYYLEGNDKKNAARMARTAMMKNPAGIFSAQGLHKFLYCNFGRSAWYQKLRNRFGKKTQPA